MLVWSDRFATNIELVDLQHKKLFELLNKLSDSFKQGSPSDVMVYETLQELMDYADKHFVDEELLMVQSKVDPRHINIQRMEHRSFLYDIKNMSGHLCTEDDFKEVSEKLVCFVTSWLTFHILGIDQAMAAQIVAIQHGATPEQAYDSLSTVKYDAAVTHLMLDSVMELWHMSLERCHRLEDKLDALNEVADAKHQ
ncbi:MAG: hemerythrin family protein [Methylobacter sp.]|nr:hemerythrin family protein [Methylobacter sp.]